MKLKSCPKCKGPATIRREKYNNMYNNVWIECELCGYRTGSMLEDRTPGRNDSGVKFAGLLWNSDKAREGGTADNGKD